MGRDEQKLKDLQKAWQDAIADAQKYVKPNEFPQILESNGAEGLNASTDLDETAYHYSLPENRLELWAYLESSRFIHPVMREFYKERNVVIEERRMRTDSNPIGRLLEQFTTAAFQAHPYHRPTIGWMADLNSFSATDAQHFFDEYYIPSNMVVAVVGDVKRREAMPVIEKYFGQIPSREKPDERTTTEPPQNSERRVVMYDRSQPLYLEGYHRPDYRSPDDAVYDAIADLMSNGRTSRLYRALVRDKKIAAYSAGFTGLPGNKYPALVCLLCIPAARPQAGRNGGGDSRGNRTPEERGHQRRGTEDDPDPSQSQLCCAVSTATKVWPPSWRCTRHATAIGASSSTRWTNLDKVTKADIRRVANQTFVPTNRTVGIIETVAPGKPAGQNGGGPDRRGQMKKHLAVCSDPRSRRHFAACTPRSLQLRQPSGSRSRFRHCLHSILRNPNASHCPTAW